MKLFGLWRKPDWQHKDAAIRARAVRSSAEPALLALLSDFAQRDPAAEVRLAAIVRIEDPSLLARRMRGEHDPQVAAAARTRLTDCLCASAFSLDERRAVLRDVIDEAMLAIVAERAAESALRRDALEKLSKPGFLFDRCLNDPDPALRLWLLERIDSPDALERVALAARKRDKALTRAARARREALQLAAGDAAALQRRVQALCERLDGISRELPSDREQQFETLQAEWNALAPRIDAELSARAQAYLSLAETALAGARRGPGALAPPAVEAIDSLEIAENAPTEVAIAPAPAPEDPALHALAAALPPAESADAIDQLQRIAGEALALRDAQPGNSTVEAQYQNLLAALAERREQHQQWRAQRRAERQSRQQAKAAAALDALDAALTAGSLTDARTARRQLIEKELAPELRARLLDADAGLAKLERWQSWSSEEVRERLCTEAEALQGSGLHPDALATRVKELQSEWARLDALDGAASGAARQAMSKRFRALCQAALEPARGFFDKRRQLQDERAAQLTSLLADIAAATANADVGQLMAWRKQLGAQMRELDGMPPSRRGELGRALREQLAALDSAINERRELAANEKRKVIARLRRELGNAERSAAIDLAKTAQAEWKRLPRGERVLEDQLWAELRALIDPLFAAVREQSESERHQQAEANAAARAVLDELAELAAADDQRLIHVEAQLEGLVSRWRSAAPAPMQQAVEAPRRGRPADAARRRPAAPSSHPQDAAFDNALAAVRAAHVHALARLDQQSMLALCEVGALLQRWPTVEADARDALRATLAELPLGPEARQAVQARLAEIETGAAVDDAQTQPGEQLAIRAELAAGLASPDDSAELRRGEQIKRLAQRMEGGALLAPTAEIRTLMITLQTTALAEPEKREAWQQRILAAYRSATAGNA